MSQRRERPAGGEPPLSGGSTRALAVCVVLLGLTLPPAAAQWTQWRGPERDGHAPGLAAPDAWPAELERRWRVEVGRGHASPLVDGGTIYLFVRDGEADRVEARRLEDGGLVWRAEDPAPYRPSHHAAEHGAGPFSTPLLHGGVLYTYNIRQRLNAWSAADGSRLWSRDFGDEFEHPHPTYGNSQSPVIADGVLVVHAGNPGDGALFGLDPLSGEERWRIDGDGAAYGSFLPTSLGGVEQLVGFTQRRLVGLDARRGHLLWEVAYDVPYDNTVVTPVVHGDAVVVAAWQTPLRAYRVSRGAGSWSVEVAWENDEIAVQHASPVLVGGRLFGHSHRNGGQLYAVDATGGVTVWLGPPRQGDEQAVLVAASPWVLTFRQDGQLEILDARAADYRPARTYRLTDAELWAHPAVWAGHLLVKDRTTLALFGLDARREAAVRP
ncbi:MAG: PQQ-binding-like beta-propeller repeat protein [Thermoanaerobaculia bacterium]|nr:PQQ-binding-like beta-propeller repeat protein [Thermoanaerobaculia bacterium]